jgi:hypothetical protein
MHIPIITALGKLRQEDHEFKVSLGYNSEFQASLDYIVRSCVQKPKQNINKNKKT